MGPAVLALVIGWCAAVIGVSAYLPQFQRLMRSRSSAGLSLWTWQVTMAGTVSWAVHGVKIGALNVIVPNLVLAVLTFLIIRMVRRDRSLSWLRMLAPSVLIATLAVSADLAVSSVLFAIVIAVPGFSGMFTQLREIAVAPALAGVSGGFLGVSVVMQAMWTTWAALVGDSSVFMVAGLSAVVAVTTLAWFVLRRVGVVQPLRRRDLTLAA